MKNIIRLAAIFSIFLFVPNLWAQSYVVVQRDTKFFPSVESKTPFLQAKKTKAFVTLEVLEEKEKRVRVKLSSQQRGSCYQDVNASDGVEYHLWVNRSDVEKVTKDVVNFSFKDRSEVELAPGVVVRSGTVFPGTSSLTLNVPKDKTAFSFKKKYLPTGRNYRNVDVKGKKGRVIKYLESKRGIKYDSNKYFKRSASQKAVKEGKFYEVKTKCFRIRGRMKNGEIKETPVFLFLTGTGGFASLGAPVPMISKSAAVLSEKGENIGRFLWDTPIAIDPKIFETVICQKKYLLSTDVQVCSKLNQIKNRSRIKNLMTTRPKTKPLEKKKISLKTKMEFKEIKVRGENPSMIKKLLHRRASAFRSCYDRQAETGTPGKVSVQAKINTSGRIKSTAIIQTEINAPAVDKCLLRVFKRIRFPKSKSETIANVIFQFSTIKK